MSCKVTNDGFLLDEIVKTETSCHSRCGKIKTKAFTVQRLQMSSIGLNLAALCRSRWRFYIKEILNSRGKRKTTDKQINICSLSIIKDIYQFCKNWSISTSSEDDHLLRRNKRRTVDDDMDHQYRILYLSSFHAIEG